MNKTLTKLAKFQRLTTQNDQNDSKDDDSVVDLPSMKREEIKTFHQHFEKIRSFNKSLKKIVGKKTNTESGKVLSGLLGNTTGLFVCVSHDQKNLSFFVFRS